MTRGNRDPKSLFTPSDCRVVDGLNVDVMVCKEFITRCFSKGGITNEDRNYMRRTRNDGNIDLLKTVFDIANINLLELTVSYVLFLVDDAGASGCDCCRGEGGSKYETRGIGPDHVDKIM